MLITMKRIDDRLTQQPLIQGLRTFLFMGLCFGASLGLYAKQADDAATLDSKDWADIQTIVDDAGLIAPDADKLDGKDWEDIEALIEDQIAQFAANSVGDYKISANTEDHEGWMLCDGRPLFSRDHEEIFNVIKCSFSPADTNCDANAETFFNLPDPRGRVAGFSGEGAGLSIRTLGEAVGEETHTLTTNEMPSHDHAGLNGSTFFLSGGIGVGGVPLESPGLTAGIHFSDAGGVGRASLTGATGNNEPHNNMPPTLFLGNLFIYVGE